MEKDEIINIHEAKTNFSKLLKKVALGQTIVIGNNGSPVATLAPFKKKRRKERIPGSAKGLIEIADDFNDPLPEEILAEFES